MDILALCLLCALIGVAVGIVGSRLFRRPVAAPVESVEPSEVSVGQTVTPAQLRQMFNAVPGATILVDAQTATVVISSRAADRLGLVDQQRIAVPALTAMVGDVFRGAPNRVEDVRLKRAPMVAGGRLDLRVRAVAVDESLVLLFAEDVSSAKRVEQVRRDFVANVSHELKTPVGALSLLSEAVLTAADEPEEVRHFADRMRVESARLAHLVADLVDLSRLQGDDPMAYAEPVAIDSVIAEAVDAVATTAEAADIEVLVGGDRGAKVFGVEGQLVTAVRNLLSNAVAYSPGHTRVAVGCRVTGDVVEITVTDQGIGIPAAEVDRIFERFYRIDPARSRHTGGTGLGLSIVKHVCQNHGGTVSVWSVEGEGSTFKLQLPRLSDAAAGNGEPSLPEEKPEPSRGSKRPKIKSKRLTRDGRKA